MSNTVTGIVTSSTQARFQSSQDFSTVFTGAPQIQFQRQLTTTDVTKCYFHTYSITSTPTSVDLTSLTDAYGAALAFTSIRHVEIVNRDLTRHLTIGGGINGVFAALPFTLVGQTGSNNTSNGSCMNLTTTIAIDGTHKILTLTASSGTIVVDVFILGN